MKLINSFRFNHSLYFLSKKKRTNGCDERKEKKKQIGGLVTNGK